MPEQVNVFANRTQDPRAFVKTTVRLKQMAHKGLRTRALDAGVPAEQLVNNLVSSFLALQVPFEGYISVQPTGEFTVVKAPKK